eukprot:COSAG03_NODE_10846_length_625_cov_3.737569_1_plen_41_part_10
MASPSGISAEETASEDGGRDRERQGDRARDRQAKRGRQRQT